ncbi:hypothetical protein [uncultured Cyclobacterium sp.]|uniref:hypothetical protein n=1 Tax=uncultured Cyclobacterium sp. TaxID=453820 RepID=UPI0030EDD76B|tara:strand:+ start:3851 stop:4048 length:198 start_codon:yes stop_codon:yes gene_type:complete
MLRDIQQVESSLNDTVMVAGSEAYLGALSYYNSVKYATKLNVAGAKIIYKTSNSASKNPERPPPM